MNRQGIAVDPRKAVMRVTALNETLDRARIGGAVYGASRRRTAALLAAADRDTLQDSRNWWKRVDEFMATLAGFDVHETALIYPGA